MPFVASYTTSYKARHSRNIDAWTPDGGVFRATSGLSFWIDASDTSSYTSNSDGVSSITDKAGNNAITINQGSVNSAHPLPTAVNNQNGIPSSMHVFELNGESFTTGHFAQVDSDGNHWSIGLVRAANNNSNYYSSVYNSYHNTFWSLENSDYSQGTANIRDYGLELGDDVAETSSSNTYFYGQLALDSANTGSKINEDEVVQSLTNTSRNLLRFDNHGNSQNLRDGGEWFIMAIVFNKTGNEILVRIDGENMFTPVPYDNSLNTDLSVRIAENRTSDSTLTTRLFMQIAEFMTFAGKPGTGGTDLSEVEKMEGYLAHKWANQSLLPTTHPYRNYSIASTGDWNPSQGFPTSSGNMDVAFWIDISDGNNFTLNANNHVDSVTDKSGNSTLSIDDVGSYGLKKHSIGGKPVLYFEGNTGISTTSTIVQSSNGNHWAIGLMKFGSISSVDDAFWHMESKDGTNGDYAVESRSSYGGWTGETQMGWLGNSDSNSSIIYWSSGSTQTIGQQTWALIAVYFNRTGNQIGARVDGVDIHTPVGYAAGNVGGQGLSTNLEVHLFKSRTGSQGTFLNGTLVEFFTFPDIPGTGGTDISFIEIAEGYLAHKWNIPGGNNAGHDFVNRNLPNDHPFKNTAP